MTLLSRTIYLAIALAFLFSMPENSPADEGMWLFNNPPRKLLKEKYGFEPTDEWLTHLRESAVRFNSGGSGSFVSAGGLVMTNHHVGADALQKLSTPDHNYIDSGFHAKSQAEEIKCVDLELNVLKSIEDVTQRVMAAVKKDLTPAEAEKARRAVMSTIEKESFDKTGLRSDVVTLYHGGQYHLYSYKKYTDVRLVFAPEKDIAFFGGDPDNFEFPRYDLDICFFRVYENDKPAHFQHYLKWSKGGADDDELVFVTGHPGRTNRLNTMDHLDFMRDRVFPTALNLIRRREVLLKTYSERSLENARRAQDEYFGYQNSRKARLGGLAGLQDPSIMDRKRREQRTLERALRKKGDDSALAAFVDVRKTLARWDDIYFDYYLLEQGQAFNTELFRIARTLLRLKEEDRKPNAERLREYRETNLDSLKQELFSEAPIYNDLEILKLADSLGMLMEMKGAEHPLVRKVLDGRSPRDRAAQLIEATKLADVSLRKKLAEPGMGESASNLADADPMLALAALVDEPSRKVRKSYEEDVEEPQRQAYAKIAAARFQTTGTDAYPDATFTLRLAFGTVKGYEENGQKIPPWTTIGGTFEHAAAHAYKEPFKLPESWMKGKDKLRPDVPFNFVSTADIIGGNSGSPVVNRRGELVGIIFDGNIYSLVLDFVYDDKLARAVSVHSAGIIEPLRKIYGADRLLKELQPGEESTER